jgi:hypothetical protein
VKKSTLALLGLFAVAVMIVALGHALDPSVVAKSALATDLVMAGVVAIYGTGARNPSTLYAQAGVYAAAESRDARLADRGRRLRQHRLGLSVRRDPGRLHHRPVVGVLVLRGDRRDRFRHRPALSERRRRDPGRLHRQRPGHSPRRLDDAAAATGSGIATPANAIKRAWELAGLTSNPGGNLEVYGTANANASAAGVANLFLRTSRARNEQ